MITLPNFDIVAAERLLVEQALARAGTINGAAELLNISRHSLRRRIIKHNLRWPPPYTSAASAAVPEAAPS